MKYILLKSNRESTWLRLEQFKFEEKEEQEKKQTKKLLLCKYQQKK